MSVSINWQPIAGAVLLIAGVVLCAVQVWRSRSQAAQTASVRDISVDKKRRADDPAPAGAVDWVADVCGAIDGAPAELILGVLKAGGSRESALIAERNSRKAAEPSP